MMFIIIILVLLWLTQVVFLQASYQVMKTKDIEKVADTILTKVDDPDYYKILNKTAYDNNMSIEITDVYGLSLYSVDMMAGSGEISGINALKMIDYRKKILASDSGYIYLKIPNERFKTQTLLFGMLIGTKASPRGFIFLNTSIDPLNSTIMILKEQMIYITIILLVLGLILSYYMARRIARPIVQITKSAEDLAQGNYNINFDGSGYDESEKLASTLNYASNEISKVDNLRRDLIANISHDIRTPLTMVKAYAEMIRDISGDNKEKRAEHVNVIIDESDRLAALVNDILDVSKIESGNQPLNCTEFNITSEILEILERYTLLSEQRGYKFEFIKDADIFVNADVLKIEQVIYNLINNAVNYTGEDKKVVIRQINKEKCVRIEISDTGAGIPKEMMPLIFDRYYRAEKNKRDVIGTGLGLSIVKAILKQHNYPFGVFSKEGKGSTFWFEIAIG